jgi:hypothetical protein
LNKENYNVNLVVIVFYLIIKVNQIFKKDIKTNNKNIKYLNKLIILRKILFKGKNRIKVI